MSRTISVCCFWFNLSKSRSAPYRKSVCHVRQVAPRVAQRLRSVAAYQLCVSGVRLWGVYHNSFIPQTDGVGCIDQCASFCRTVIA
jgi:hypothetical protein